MTSILTLNAGSSSLKFALYEVDTPPGLFAWGQVEHTGEQSRLQLDDRTGRQIKRSLGSRCGPAETLEAVLDAIAIYAQPKIVGHRIVHGGKDFIEPVLIDHQALRLLEQLDHLAPLHQPHNLAAVRHFMKIAPDLPQAGVFDTAFHAGIPAIAQYTGLPRHYHQRGIRRYGFHGLSYQHSAAVMAELEPQSRRIIVAHLGNGASMCAIKDGRSIETSMGFSALDGLLMGTRCGSLDPGVVMHLMGTDKLNLDELEDLLYEESGLLGVSGISHDVRKLLASDTAEARLALELFAYRVVQNFGALYAVLGGADALIFTGGIGENAAPVRQAIASGLSWTGLLLDPQANADNAAVLHSSSSTLTCRIIPCDEQQVLAEACIGLL